MSGKEQMLTNLNKLKQKKLTEVALERFEQMQKCQVEFQVGWFRLFEKQSMNYDANTRHF